MDGNSWMWKVMEGFPEEGRRLDIHVGCQLPGSTKPVSSACLFSRNICAIF